MSGNRSPEVIHIATHGFFFPDSRKQQYTNSNPEMGRIVFRTSDNPLNRAGLIFAGGNRTWQ